MEEWINHALIQCAPVKSVLAMCHVRLMDIDVWIFEFGKDAAKQDLTVGLSSGCENKVQTVVQFPVFQT